jgi:GTPase
VVASSILTVAATMKTIARRTLLRFTMYCTRPSCCFRHLSDSANNKDKRRLDVAIVGAPNAGKSQLLNVLCKSNVAAVSRKRHTTRDGIMGARTVDNTQIVFVDTPGFLRQKSARQEGVTRNMALTAMSEMEDVDYTLIVIDAARNVTDDHKETLVKLMLKAIHSGGRIEGGLNLNNGRVPPPAGEKFAIVLNKVDLVKPKRILLDVSDEIGDMAEACIKYGELGEQAEQDKLDPERLAELFPPIFYVSALHDEGVNHIWNLLMSKATPSQEWVLSADQVTMLSPLERVEEVIREKIYRCLHREVPHHVQQVNRNFQFMQGDNKMLRVDQDLVVTTKSHQRLVLGQGGKTLKRIQETAKVDLEHMFGCPVMLHLHVKLTKSKQPQTLFSETQGTRIVFPS